MFKKPITHAIAATVYITLIVSVMTIGERMSFGPEGLFSRILIPIAMLSLFTLSAAVMGYLFLAEPLQLYLDGKKREAVRFFAHTILAFSILTLCAFVLILLGRAL